VVKTRLGHGGGEKREAGFRSSFFSRRKGKGKEKEKRRYYSREREERKPGLISTFVWAGGKGGEANKNTNSGGRTGRGKRQIRSSVFSRGKEEERGEERRGNGQ